MSAAYTPPKTFVDGDVLPASDLNAMNTAIDNAFATIEGQIVSPAEANFKAQFGHNDIINGRFWVWNEGWLAAHPATQDPADNAALAEMWFMSRAYTGGTVEVVRHDITAGPQGRFDYALRINSLTQAASGANDYLAATYRMEGNTLRDFEAKTGTLVFTALSSPGGTFSVVFTNNVDQWLVAEYTLVDNTWTDVYIPFPLGASSGTWHFGENTGLSIHFTFGAGSAVKTSTLGSWQGTAYWAGSNQADQVNQANGRLLLQNVWLIPNAATASTSFSPPRDGRSLTETQMLTQRYFEKTFDLGTPIPTATTAVGSMTYEKNMVVFPPPEGLDTPSTPGGALRYRGQYRIEKRADATVTIYSADTGASGNLSLQWTADTPAVVAAGQRGKTGWTSSLVGGVDEYLYLHYIANARLT